VLIAVYFLLTLLLILLNAFFVLAEFSTVKMRPTRVEELIDQGNKKAILVRHIQEHFDEYLSVCQVGITFASIGLGFVGEPAVADVFEPLLSRFGAAALGIAHTLAITIAYVLVSFLHVTLGELVPKSVSLRATDVIALNAAPMLRFFYFLFYLPRIAVNKAASLILSLMNIPLAVPREQHSEEELRIILGKSQTGGLMPFRRLLLMENVFDLGDMKVKDAMRPRALVKGLWLSAPWEENFRIIRESRLSRLPLMKDGADKPVGIIHIKDLLYAGAEKASAVDLEKLARPYHRTVEDAPLENVLAELQRRRMHLAIVVDKNDRWTGLITMEDVIEEIVGTVEDEFELEPPIFLTDTLSIGRVVLGVEAPSIEEAIRRAVSRIPREELPFSPENIIRMMKDRTLMAVSFLGEGLCVSHARAEGLDKPILMFARSDGGVTLKGVPEKAHLLFLLLTPAHQPRVQARLLSRIGGLVESEYVEERLRHADSPQAVLEAIRAGETAALG
jgi:CBS domain containing-hemolysin-like protein